MPSPSVTYTFSNGATIVHSEQNQNFNDIINGLTDGTKDLTISALTAQGNLTVNGNTTIGSASTDTLTVNASLASTIAIGTNNSYDIGAATLGLAGVYLGAPSSRTTRIRAHQSLSGSNTLVLPNGNGSASQALITDGSGNLSFTNTFTTGKTIDGTADEVQLTVQGHSTQTSNVLLVEKSDGTDLFTINNSGDVTIAGHSYAPVLSGATFDFDAPPYSFVGSTNTGMYAGATSQVNFSCAGVKILEIIRGTGNDKGQLNVGASAIGQGNQDTSIYIKSANAGIIIQTTATSGSHTCLNFADGAGSSGGTIVLDTTANTTAYNTSSDERLKSNIRSFNALDLVKKMNPVEYERHSDPGKKEIGFSAQELYEVFPQAVRVGGNDPKKEPWMMDYGKLTGVLCKGLKELMDRVDSIENQLSSVT